MVPRGSDRTVGSALRRRSVRVTGTGHAPGPCVQSARLGGAMCRSGVRRLGWSPSRATCPAPDDRGWVGRSRSRGWSRTLMSSSSSFVHLHVHTEFSMLDGAARVDGLFDATARLEMPAIAMTDHGNLFGAYDFYQGAPRPAASSRSSASRPTSPRRPTQSSGAGCVGQSGGGGDDVSGGGAYTHVTISPRPPRACTTCSGSRRCASIEGHFYKPRMDRELLQRYAQRPDRHHGLPVRRDPDAAAARPVRRGAPVGRRVPRPLRHRQLLPRADGPRTRDREPGPRRPAPAGQGPRPPARRHQRPALHQAGRRRRPRRPALRAVRARPSTTRTGSSSTATATTSSLPTRCGASGPTSPRPATTPC